MKTWLKGGLVGLVIGVILALLQRYLMFSDFIFIFAIRYGRSITILSSIIFFSFLWYALGEIKKEGISLTKKGFLVGLLFALLIFLIIPRWALYYMQYYGLEEALRTDGVDSIYEPLFYTFIFIIASIIIGTLIGFVTQKTKEKKDWQNWSYTKKGFIIGLYSGIVIFCSWMIYIIYYIFNRTLYGEGFSYAIKGAFRDSFGNLVTISTLILPIVIITIIGWIIQKIKSQ